MIGGGFSANAPPGCASLPAALLLLEYGLAHSDWAHFLQLRRAGSLSTTCPPPTIIAEGFAVESADECRLCVLRARLLLHRQRLYTFVDRATRKHRPHLAIDG